MRLKNGGHSWKKSILTLAALLLLLVGLVGALWASNGFGWRAWRLQEVQAFIGAALPEGANDVQFATQNQKTRIVWLRFAIPPDHDLADFLVQMGITTALRSGFTPFTATNPQEAALNWWTPQTTNTFAGLYDNTGQKIIEILLDNDQQVVYVRVYAIAG